MINIFILFLFIFIFLILMLSGNQWWSWPVGINSTFMFVAIIGKESNRLVLNGWLVNCHMFNYSVQSIRESIYHLLYLEINHGVVQYLFVPKDSYKYLNLQLIFWSILSILWSYRNTYQSVSVNICIVKGHLHV